MEETPRWGRWTVVALVALTAAVALGALAASCSGGDGATATAGSTSAGAGGPSARDVAALTDPGVASTTTERATTTTSSSAAAAPTGGADGSEPSGDGRGAPGAGTGSGGGGPAPVQPLGAADCAALELVVIPAAAIITEDDFVPLDQRAPSGGGADRVAALERVATVAPAERQAAWSAVAAAEASAQAEGRPATDREVVAFRAARDATEVWARAACPGAPPSWRCNEFGSIGPGPDVAPTRAEAPSPAAVLRRYPDTGRAEELQRTADVVLYGWVTDQGFVTRTHQVERIGGGWATARRHVCHDEP